MIEMISTAEHEYRQQQLKVGDPFMCDDEHVTILTGLGRAKVKSTTDESVAPVEKPAESAEDQLVADLDTQLVKPRGGRNQRKRS